MERNTHLQKESYNNDMHYIHIYTCAHMHKQLLNKHVCTCTRSSYVVVPGKTVVQLSKL